MNSNITRLLFIALLIAGLIPACTSSRKLSQKCIVPAFISIQVKKEDRHIKVQWITRNACAQGTYLIERSIDNENFEIIGLRQAVVTGPNREMDFFFIDKDTLQEQVFYRVRLLDINNIEMVSKAVPQAKHY